MSILRQLGIDFVHKTMVGEKNNLSSIALHIFAISNF